jgi:hypothetical protein
MAYEINPSTAPEHFETMHLDPERFNSRRNQPMTIASKRIAKSPQLASNESHQSRTETNETRQASIAPRPHNLGQNQRHAIDGMHATQPGTHAAVVSIAWVGGSTSIRIGTFDANQ